MHVNTFTATRDLNLFADVSKVIQLQYKPYFLYCVTFTDSAHPNVNPLNSHKPVPIWNKLAKRPIVLYVIYDLLIGLKKKKKKWKFDDKKSFESF